MTNDTTIFSIVRSYGTPKSALKYLERIRFEGTLCCVKCGSIDKLKPQKEKPGRYWCGNCKDYFHIFTGTPLEGTRIAPEVWVLAAYLQSSLKKGMSSHQMAELLGVQQRTVWKMLDLFRRAVKTERVRLKGKVEVDEAWIGGSPHLMHSIERGRIQRLWGNRKTRKSTIMGMIERSKGAVILMVIPDRKRKTLLKRIYQHVEPGSTIYTDALPAYQGLNQGYKHHAVNHSAGQYVDGEIHTNSIESVWALLKRAHKGTYHKISRKFLYRYLDWFAFHLTMSRKGCTNRDKMDCLFQKIFEMGKKNEV